MQIREQTEYFLQYIAQQMANNDEYIRQFNGKLMDFDSKEEKKEHQKGLKIYLRGSTVTATELLNRGERRAKAKRK